MIKLCSRSCLYIYLTLSSCISSWWWRHTQTFPYCVEYGMLCDVGQCFTFASPLPSKKKNIMATSYLMRRSFNSNPEIGTLLFSHQQWHEPLILFSLGRRHGLLLLQVLNRSILFHYHLKEMRKCIPLNENRNGCLGRALRHNELNLLEPKDSDVQYWAVFKKITFSGRHGILSQRCWVFFIYAI